jgi:sugar lactone lactonase YvrE
MRLHVLLGCTLSLAACASATNAGGAGDIRAWDPESAVVVPEDRSLVRPEDGVVLPDGRLLITDQRHGLVLLGPDGPRPFGGFAAAGYVHEPPSRNGGANSVSLEPDGTHVLVADALTGAIYRVDLASETTERIHQHSFGVNSAVGDRTGAVWFTQSTENAGPDSEGRLFAALDREMPDGALYRIVPPAAGGAGPGAERKVAGLYFPNGLVIDDRSGALYLTETGRDRVLGFRVDSRTGELSDRRVVATVTAPDNVEMDDSGRLWVASPLANEVLVVEPASGTVRSVFRSRTAASEGAAAEWRRRTAAGEPRLSLLVPELWEPLPGPITGVMLTPGGGPVYLTGLGNAVLRLDAPPR